MEPGRLRTPVSIEKLTRTTVAGKTSSSSVKVGATRYCQLMKQGSREFVFAKESNSSLTHLLRMRFTSDATPGRRLKLTADNDRILNILGMDNVGGHDHEMLVSCKEDTTSID